MSEYGAEIVREEAPGAPALKISFPHFSPGTAPTNANSSISGVELAPERFVVAAFGHMTPAKRIDVAIEAFARFSKEFPGAVFLLAGEESPNFPIRKVIARQASENIHYLGYIGDGEAERLLGRADVFINLRYPSNGEMSASLMRMLGLGKVVIVSNYAQFAEFPDSTCAKIDLGPGEVDDLAGELLALARDEGRRARIGEAAREHVSMRHGPGDAADAIIAFARENSASEPRLSGERIECVLFRDNFLLRYPRMIAYNGMRLLRRAGEQGIATAALQAFTRAPGRT
jgi:glycosyltransferase involved in cell wall biosynthesis